MNYEHILVAADFSEFSAKAVEFAFAFGKQCRGRLTLAHVVEPFKEEIGETIQPHDSESWARKEEKEIQQQVQPYLDKAGSNQMPIDFVMLRGFNPADTLLDFLGANRFDLLVIGTHGRGALKHLFQGSVAERMVRVSPIPVLTVHRSVEKFNIEKILVPIDFSPNSQLAADYAASIARIWNAKIVFFHTIEPEIYPSDYDYENSVPVSAFDRNLHQTVLENLKEFVADSVHESRVENYVVKEGLAHKEIVKYAKQNKVDLLVIATLGLTGMAYLLLGSTAEKVIRWTTCPVLTVKGNQ